MTEKRFTIDVETENYENAYFENDKFLCYEDDYDAILKRLNELADENKELKQFKQQVINLIDEKISFVDACNQNYKLSKNYYRGALDILELLKKECFE